MRGLAQLVQNLAERVHEGKPQAESANDAAATAAPLAIPEP